MKNTLKRIILLSLVLSLFTNLSAEKVKGIIQGDGQPLGEVLVTDGYTFCVTDVKGRYEMDTHPDAEFVYIVTPKGYVADYSSGVPQFYQRIEAGKQEYHFDLLPMKGNPDQFAMMVMADVQLDTEHDVKRMMDELLPDAKQTVATYPDKQMAGLVLGDLTWDVYKYNLTFKDFARQVGIPFYPVIGNHDFDKYLTPTEGADFAKPYKDAYGPLYYAVQLGDVYFIVLNSMEYYGNKRYKTTLDLNPQMEWLSLLLKCVLQQEKHVYLAMHAPMKPSPDSPMIGGGEKLKSMLINKFHATILSGHYHLNTNSDLGGGLWEHNVASAGGTWWTSNVCRDGTPNGYRVYVGDKSHVEQYYKSTGKDKDYQMKVYAPRRIMDRPEEVVVNIWNWDANWQVVWYEDGKYQGAMNQFYSFNPDYLQWLNGRRAVADYAPVRTNYYFSAKPSPKAKEVRIEVTDRYGNVYREVVKLK